MMKKSLHQFFSRGQNESLESDTKTQLNEQGQARNNLILGAALLVVMVGFGLFWFISNPTATPVKHSAPSLGAVLDDEYTREDAQSAERSNERTLEQLAKQVKGLSEQNARLLEQSDAQEDKAAAAALTWEQEKSA
ncbi:hypothetical protein AB4427_17620, partial [Vibrio artabrorum]